MRLGGLNCDRKREGENILAYYVVWMEEIKEK
jgi:hypothetical protein